MQKNKWDITNENSELFDSDRQFFVAYVSDMISYF